MKKSQRARLAELTAKAEADRTAIEKAEFAFLSQLATAHPDAAKDVDDTSSAAAGNAASPATAAASPAAGANAPPPAPAVAAAQPPAGPTLRGFIQSLRGGAAVGADLVAARQTIAERDATIATLTTERDQARNDVAAAQATIASLNSQLATFSAFFGLAAADLAGKKPAEVNALIQQKISAEAIERLAGAGAPAAGLPAPSSSPSASGDALEDIQAQMKTEKDPEKLGQLAKRANALRDKAWGGAN